MCNGQAKTFIKKKIECFKDELAGNGWKIECIATKAAAEDGDRQQQLQEEDSVILPKMSFT